MASTKEPKFWMRYLEMIHVHHNLETIDPMTRIQNVSLLAQVLALRHACNMPWSKPTLIKCTDAYMSPRPKDINAAVQTRLELIVIMAGTEFRDCEPEIRNISALLHTKHRPHLYGKSFHPRRNFQCCSPVTLPITFHCDKSNPSMSPFLTWIRILIYLCVSGEDKLTLCTIYINATLFSVDIPFVWN